MLCHVSRYSIIISSFVCNGNLLFIPYTFTSFRQIIGKFLTLTILMVSMVPAMCRYSCNTLLRREALWGLCRPFSNKYLRSEVKSDYVTAIGLAYLCKRDLSSCVKTEFTNGFPDNLIYAWCNGVDYCKRFR